MRARTVRIIPTRMGTRTYFFDVSFNARDHPHAYGDKYNTIFANRMKAGSSPRVWGQVKTYFNEFCAAGIIPTRMGTSKLLVLI